MFDLLEDVLSTDMEKIIEGCIGIEDPYPLMSCLL